MSDSTNPSSDMSQLISAVGEIKGILSTVIVAHAERISKAERENTQLRNDLTGVRNEASVATAALALLVEANKNKITEVASDVQEVKDKQNSTGQRTTMILSPVLAAGALAWSVLGGKP